MSLHCEMTCEACGRSWTDHTSQCPRGQIISIVETQKLNVRCPLYGCSGRLEINSGDFFECEKCQVQFCSGHGAGEDVTKLEKFMLIGGRGQVLEYFTGTTVVKLSFLGEGKFKIHQAIARLVVEEEECKKRRKSSE